MEISSERQSIATSIVPALRTTTVTGTAVDLGINGGHDGATVYFTVGALTDGTHTPSITECATSGGSYTAVAAGDLSTTLSALAANTDQKVGYKGTKQYIKAVITVTGGPATGCAAGAVVVRGKVRSIAQTGLT